MPLERIGRYQIKRTIGEGGMGVVYAAHDDRLDRLVAIKVVRPEALAADGARERFRREARAAARVSHPHICPLYEFDEVDGQPFLVMELLDGEPLSARLMREAVPVDEALDLAETMLDALAALHRRGVVHRDLKPANVFLTPHGLRLLDFGLAQPLAGEEKTRDRLTGPGMLMGTPQYMAPEQLLEGRVDERADVFAAASVVYEMLAGRPAFDGRTLPAILHAVGYSDPAPLQGSSLLVRIDAVLHDAMRKDPGERIARAEQFAARLREARHATAAHVAPVPRTSLTRFVALPLRILKPDPDTDFLAFSVPDAVSVALAALESVVVRSAQVGVPADADVRAIGRSLSVDVVLTGTLLRSGGHVRVSAQLADATAGTIIWADVAQAPIEDLFQLQDTLTERIVASLSLPLTARDRRSLDRQAPASAEAYELYLRANQLATDQARWREARDLYRRSVELDPEYAPAWARLGRAERVLGKWAAPGDVGLLAKAEAAFKRAFELDPDLSITHDLAAYADAEAGRAVEAMERLLDRAARKPNDTGVLAGLVTTCRYAGVFEGSKAAHQRVVAIVPTQVTSVCWTYMMLGDFETAIRLDKGSPPYCALLSKVMLGELDLETLRQMEHDAPSQGVRLAVGAYRSTFEKKFDETLRILDDLAGLGFSDPEGWYLYAFCFVVNGAAGPALEYATRAVDGGYVCHAPLTSHPQWTRMTDSTYRALVERTAVMVMSNRARYEAAGGPSVLSGPVRASSRNVQTTNG